MSVCDLFGLLNCSCKRLVPLIHFVFKFSIALYYFYEIVLQNSCDPYIYIHFQWDGTAFPVYSLRIALWGDGDKANAGALYTVNSVGL